jgi:hypothetical protein
LEGISKVRTISAKNLVATRQDPIFKKGGPSSSTLLNSLHNRVSGDLAQLWIKEEDLSRRQTALSEFLDSTVLGMQSVASYLEGILPAAPVGRGLVDLWSSTYIAGGNTAEIDVSFGQATLDVEAVEEKMYAVAPDESVWIPGDSTLSYRVEDSFDSDVPSDELFISPIEDYLGLGPNPDTFFIGTQVSGTKYVYVKATLPSNLTPSRVSNRLTFSPLPAFNSTLRGVWVRNTAGVWTSIDFSYLTGYTSSTVPRMGPFKLHFDPLSITQAVVCFACTNTLWGVRQFGIQKVEYDTSNSLQVDFDSYSPGTIRQVLIHGKDESTLAALPYTVVGSEVHITLSQLSSLSTPVITGVEARW